MRLGDQEAERIPNAGQGARVATCKSNTPVKVALFFTSFRSFFNGRGVSGGK
jgi:hypothetical protein